MPGAKPGERRGGRQKGTPNKATRERQINAAAEIDRARREGRELAKDVLERFMKLAEGACAVNRPTAAEDIAKGKAENPDGDWGRFGEWFDRTVYCAKELAKYQSPQIKGVDAPAPPPDPKTLEQGSKRKFGLRVFEGGRALEPSVA